jgi:hypothetical protein
MHVLFWQISSGSGTEQLDVSSDPDVPGTVLDLQRSQLGTFVGLKVERQPTHFSFR